MKTKVKIWKKIEEEGWLIGPQTNIKPMNQNLNYWFYWTDYYP